MAYNVQKAKQAIKDYDTTPPTIKGGEIKFDFKLLPKGQWINKW